MKGVCCDLVIAAPASDDLTATAIQKHTIISREGACRQQLWQGCACRNKGEDPSQQVMQTRMQRYSSFLRGWMDAWVPIWTSAAMPAAVPSQASRAGHSGWHLHLNHPSRYCYSRCCSLTTSMLLLLLLPQVLRCSQQLQYTMCRGYPAKLSRLITDAASAAAEPRCAFVLLNHAAQARPRVAVASAWPKAYAGQVLGRLSLAFGSQQTLPPSRVRLSHESPVLAAQLRVLQPGWGLHHLIRGL